MSASSLSAASVVITGLFHDLTLKRSTVSVVWDNDPDKRMALPVPYGCSLDELQAEAEKRCGNCPRWSKNRGRIAEMRFWLSMSCGSPVGCRASAARCNKSRARPASPRSRPAEPVDGAGG